MRLLPTLVLASVVMMGCKSQASTAPTERTVQAPDFELTDLQGKKLKLSDLRGQVVFLDFWATWCPPCVMSSPEVDRLVQDYKGKSFVVLSISLDSSDAPVKRFVASHKISSRVALAGSSGVDYKYSVEGIPAFFVINKSGDVTKVWQGYNPAMSTQWRKEIDTLLTR